MFFKRKINTDLIRFFFIGKIHRIIKNNINLVNSNFSYFKNNLSSQARNRKLSRKISTKYSHHYYQGLGSNYEFVSLPRHFLEKTYLKKKTDNIREYVPIFKNQKILDIGCGNGLFLDFCNKAGFRTVGMDISKDAINEAEEYKGTKFIVHNAMARSYPFPKNYFDVITAFDLIEHLEKPNLLLLNIYKHLKPGGIAYLITPNGKQKTDKDVTHISLKKISDWESLIIKNNFRILKSYTYRWYPPNPYLLIQKILWIANVLKGNYIEQAVIMFKKE